MFMSILLGTHAEGNGEFAPPFRIEWAWNLSQCGLLLHLFLAPYALTLPYAQGWPAYRCRGNRRHQSKLGEILDLHLEPQ